MTNTILNLETEQAKEAEPTNEEPTVADQVKSALADLVGEGKKFKDEEALAESKIQADKFITQLQEETKGMRETISDLQAKLVRAETQGEVDNLRRQLSERTEDKNKSEEITPPALAAEDLDKLIEERITQREIKASASANVNQTNEALAKHFGNDEKASEAVKARITELGISVEDISAMAAKSPTAALALIKGDSKSTISGMSKQSSVNIVSDPSVAEENSKAWFDNIRRTAPDQYWSPAVQNQIFQLKAEDKYE